MGALLIQESFGWVQALFIFFPMCLPNDRVLVQANYHNILVKMRITIIPVLLATAASLSAVPIDVTQPSDPIQVVNGVNDGDAAAGPSGPFEGVESAIDNNVGTKYLNFLDLGSGLAVQPALGSTILSGLRLTTANDAPGRDPASFVLSGASSLAGPWTLIASGPLALPAARFSSQEISFLNTVPFEAYQLIFPTLKDSGNNNSMQIAEVELLGVAATAASGVPDAGSSAALFGLALAGCVGLRKGLAK